MSIIAFLAIGAAASPPTVRTSSGEVYGTPLPASSIAVPVSQFLGIPFAKAERWEPPVDFKDEYKTQPLNATMWGAACLQIGADPSVPYGSEECLMANVWKPAAATPQSNLPVLVFIYGGSDQFGEAEPYNMSALSAFHNVITVNFNYRTGAIGWMAFEEDYISKRPTGNWGLLDIQSALRWVQREVRAFGGDASRVAIHGQSSGGGLVELQYVAPASSGLFHAVRRHGPSLCMSELNLHGPSPASAISLSELRRLHARRPLARLHAPSVASGDLRVGRSLSTLAISGTREHPAGRNERWLPTTDQGVHATP